MVILGIDPGYAIVGYGAISYVSGRYRTLGYGAVLTDSNIDFSMRLEVIYDNMIKMIDKCKPDVLAIEKLYFQNNQKTAIKVAEARGVILLSARKSDLPVFEYTPLQVKTAVTGYGKAPKKQVMEMTKRLLGLNEVPKPDDTADALAVSICHANTAGSLIRMDLIKRGSKANVL